jgi:DNA-binding beta-propeller fold protein YncE
MTLIFPFLSAILLFGSPAAAQSVLTLEGKIQLGEIRGRLDHMAIDLARQRLFVAQLENDTVGVVDYEAREIAHVITNVKRPQGLAYVRTSDALFVANGGDGSVRMFGGSEYQISGRVELGDNADNVRFDAEMNRILVAYGSGALAVIDASSGRRLDDIALTAQAESFQIDRGSNRIYVNSPKEEAVVVLDRASGKHIAAWPTGNASNFPMAVNETASHVLVAFRNPPKLVALATRDGAVVATAAICADADDMFLDDGRSRIYVSCGEGFVDVLDAKQYKPVARVATAKGARTSLFVPGIGRLFVAARATPEAPAAVWVFRPEP